MLILIFGTVCFATGLFVLVLTLATALTAPLAALVVFGPLLLVLGTYLWVLSGRERLRKALYLDSLERSSKFRRF